MSGKRWKVLSAVTAAGVAGAAGFAVHDGRAGTSATPQEAAAAAQATADVRRGDVAERRWVTGTLGYAGETAVVAPGPGILTRLPAAGDVIARGGALYETDGVPVLLMYGSRPPWRPFGPGMTDGADVEQLEANLVALGHGGGLTVDRRFTAATAQAVRRWQRAAGLPVTGEVPLGRVVFLPDAVRVGTASLPVGAEVAAGVVVSHGTGAALTVQFQLVPRQLPAAKAGDAVVVTLPDGTSRTGTIQEIGAVSTPAGDENPSQNGGQNQASAPVTVLVEGALTGLRDHTQVQVAVTVAVHQRVLAVPVTALNPVAGGGYEVVVVDGGATRRVAVEAGIFDERAGLVEVRGDGLADGQKVRVPRATS
ncbi:peptidoglycan-binding domain-containing protein [Dactylosporangium sp. NPDC006015]|uniref:peptidoglycan-binding domain-containing protein n=1 Tax=Dactylosporangium sp. NPDC006015 TaxID=3154576 RepID=UPI0033A96DDF